MHFSDLSFFMVICIYAVIGIVCVLIGMSLYVAFKTIHEMLHPTDGQRIAKAAVRCRKVGLNVKIALTAARHEAESLGYACSKEFFSYWYETQFGKDIWKQEVSFFSLFKKRFFN